MDVGQTKKREGWDRIWRKGGRNRRWDKIDENDRIRWIAMEVEQKIKTKLH